MAGPRVKFEKKKVEEVAEIIQQKDWGKLLMVPLIALSVMFTTGTVLFFMVQHQLEEQERLKAEMERRKRLANREPEEFAFSPIRVNLRESKSGFRFFELHISVKILPGKPTRELQAKMSLIREELNFLLGEKTETDLTKPSARTELKKEVLGTINQLLKKTQIKEIFFSNYLLEK